MPGKDDKFYKLLGVSKDVTPDELKKAYRKAALKHHPDRGGDAAKFKEVSEAYETLSDPNSKAVYDQFGEDGLKGQPPPGAGGNPFAGAGGNPFAGFGGGGMPGGASFSFSSGGPGGGRAGHSDPRDLFSQLFGDLGGMAGMSGMPGRSSRFAGAGGPSGMQFDSDDDYPSMSGAMPGMPRRPTSGRRTPTSGPPEPSSEVVKPLPISLEDLYTGTTKKMKVSRKLLDGTTEDRVLELTIKAGYKKGTKLRFKDAGNEESKGGQRVSQDVVFEIQEKPHDRFSRDGDDCILHFKIPLVDALTGVSTPAAARKTIQTLDKRSLSFTIPFPSYTTGGKPIHPGQEVRVAGEGFPITRANATKRKGDLIVRLDVTMPDRVSSSQAEALRKALAA